MKESKIIIKKQKVKINDLDENYEWIEVKFVLYLDGNLSEKEIIAESNTIMEIFLNGQILFTENNAPMGYMNPKINPKFGFMGHVEKIYGQGLSKCFISERKKDKKNWRLTFNAFSNGGLTIKKYSTNLFFRDWQILKGIDESLREKYNQGGGYSHSFSPIFIDGEPGIEMFDKLMIFKFKLKDKLKYGDNEFCNDVLKNSAKEIFNIVVNMPPAKWATKKDRAPIKKWIKEVNKLLKE